VRNGKSVMPQWKDLLNRDKIEDVSAYVRTGGAAA
jgi:mono/diheme cytochrome c family protein